jgi:hypothetical protein
VKGLRDGAFEDREVKCFEVDFEESSLGGSAVIARLKDRGYWVRDFDRFNFPALFGELDGTAALGRVVRFLERLMNECDPTSALLSERAKYLAQSRNLTFGEALARISQKSFMG